MSIIAVSAVITSTIILSLAVVPSARYGWLGERFVWVYIGTLWLGGLKVWSGTRRAVAELDENGVVLRPLHQFREKRFAWEAIRGTEQMLGGDRLIVYFDTPRGMRFVALNLNLVKGRRDFLARLDGELIERAFVEKIVDRSRYLSRPSDDREIRN